MRAAPRLSIVIVSFNTGDDLAHCLTTLADAPPAVPHEIVVVDNASHDGSPGMVRTSWPAVRVIELPENVGFARASNAGIRASVGELILLLNSDTSVPPGAIDALMARLAAHRQAAAAGPRLVDGAGEVELSFGPMMAPCAELRQKVLGTLYTRRNRAAVAWVARVTARERFVDWVSGAALLVHRRDAERVGLLDERYFLYTEDVDFCAALRATGRQILFTPAVTITHLRGRSRATARAASALAYRRSHLAFYEKHHPRWARLLRVYLWMKGELPAVR
jgi:N-acetylglucosaminyl-diphospho-decaprenol L-rhamnosyltransferase